jgi:hypothetical protein
MLKLKIALALAERGYAVFPLQANSRRPIKGSAGYKDATTEPWLIEAMWAEAGEDANIGLYPWGSTPRQIVVDFEGPGKGHNLDASLAEFGKVTSQSADTRCAATPSGGLHLYFAVPDDCPDLKSAVRFLPGVDIRAKGGYVVAPGSTIGDKRYTWSGTPSLRGLTCADKLPKVAIKPASGPAGLVDVQPNLRAAVAFLKETEPAIEGDGGDDWTYRTACKVRDFGVSEDLALKIMLSHWNSRCEPPWDEDELARKVANAYEYAGRAAGSEAGDPNEIFGELLAGEMSREAKKPSRFFPHKVASLTGRPAPKWLVDKTLPESGIGFLVGPWGSYKSFLAIDLAWSVALGKPWGGFDVPLARPTVFIAGEGPHGIIRRFQAWAHRMNIETWPEGLRMVENMPHLAEPDQVKELVGELKTLEPGLIVIDTLSVASAGADENSSKDMGQVLQSAKYLQAQAGGFVLMIHHTGKDLARGARGWSGLGGTADALALVKSGERSCEVIFDKIRDAEKWPEAKVFTALEVSLSLPEPYSTLAFRHDPNAVAESAEQDQKKELRMQAMGEILVPGLAPVKTKALAHEIAAKTSDDLEPEEFDRHRRTIETWLRRLGQSLEGKAWCEKEEGGALTWRHPA